MTRRQVRVGLVALAVGLLAGTAGCAGGTSRAPEPADYTEPSWMAEVRAQDEEYAARMLSCLEGEGQQAEIVDGVVLVSVDLDDDGRPRSAGAQEAADRAGAHCSEAVPQPEYYANSLEGEYERMIDVRDCVLDRGHDLPEAPGKEAWIESEGAFAPLVALSDREAAGEIELSEAEWRELTDACTASARGKLLTVSAGG